MIKTLKSKLFRIRVTALFPDYEGSIAIGSEIMEAAGLLKWESVIINHQSNGRSWETYVIPSKDPCSCELRGGSVAGLGADLGDYLVILAWRWDRLDQRPNNPAILHFNHVNRLMPWDPE